MMESKATPTRSLALPDDLDSPQAKLVYLYLETTESATPAELTDSLSMQKLSVLSVLRLLSSTGLVDRDGDRFVVST